MDVIRKYLTEHEVASFWFSVLLAILILLPIIGWEHLFSNLLSFYNGENAGEKLFSAWITFFIVLLTGLIREGNWKGEDNIHKAVIGLILAFYIYHYAKNDLIQNASTENWFMSSSFAINNVLNSIGEQLPDWFYANGWLYLWYIIRNIIKYLLSLALIYIFPSFVLAIPLKIIYYFWHKPKDLPSNTYEMAGVLVLFPLFFYLSLWITYNSPFYEHWFSQSIYLFVACIVVFIMAAYRHRCPNCGCSSLEILNRTSNTDKEVYTGSIMTWKEWSDGVKTDQRTTHHYEQKTHHNSLYKCSRCGHSWWESYTSTRKFDR